jgi:uncharacterized membrane protein
MNSLLLYFKEDCIELWSIDKNDRLIPVTYISSNQLPLYFLIDGDKILMEDYAKEQYSKGISNSFGNFWRDIDNDSLTYERYSAKKSFSTLLPYALKESILPKIAKSHFQVTLKELLTGTKTILLYDSFVPERHKEIILNLFYDIVGFDRNSIISIDFFEYFRDFQINKRNLNQADSFIVSNISDGDFYIHYIGNDSPFHKAMKVLEGKGHDPSLDVVLNILAENVRQKGGMQNESVVKRELISDAKAILSKIPNGYVIHKIENNKIDVDSFEINIHRKDIEDRVNNRQSLNIIQNELEVFRKQYSLGHIPMFLSGLKVNQSSFRDFFRFEYKGGVNYEDENFNKDFIKHCIINGSKKISLVQVPVQNPLESADPAKASSPSVDKLNIPSHNHKGEEKVFSNQNERKETDSQNAVKSSGKVDLQSKTQKDTGPNSKPRLDNLSHSTGVDLTLIKKPSSKEEKSINNKEVKSDLKLNEEEIKLGPPPIIPSTYGPKFSEVKENATGKTSERGKRIIHEVASDTNKENLSKVERKKIKVMPKLLGVVAFTFLIFQLHQKLSVNATGAFSVEFANLLGSDIFIAIGYFTEDWESEGWFELEPNTSKTFKLPQNFNHSKVFLFGVNANDDLLWNGDDIYLCIDPDLKFHLYDHKNCDFLEGFKEFQLTGNHTLIEIKGIDFYTN